MAQFIQEINHLITLILEVDHQNKEIHEFSHKTDIVDQIAKIPQQHTSSVVNFNDNPRIPTDPSENYPFFQQNKNSKKPYHYKQKTLYYTPNYHSSDDDEFPDQNHQQNFQNQRLQSYQVNQLDIFEPYTREQHMRQPRSNYEPQNNNFYSQIQQILIIIKQRKCKTKYRYHIICNNMR